MMPPNGNMSVAFQWLISSLSKFPMLAPTTFLFKPIRSYQFVDTITLSQPLLFHSSTNGHRIISIATKLGGILSQILHEKEETNFRYDFTSPGSHFIEFKDLPLNTSLHITIVDENKDQTDIQASEICPEFSYRIPMFQDVNATTTLFEHQTFHGCLLDFSFIAKENHNYRILFYIYMYMLEMLKSAYLVFFVSQVILLYNHRDTLSYSFINGFEEWKDKLLEYGDMGEEEEEEEEEEETGAKIKILHSTAIDDNDVFSDEFSIGHSTNGKNEDEDIKNSDNDSGGITFDMKVKERVEVIEKRCEIYNTNKDAQYFNLDKASHHRRRKESECSESSWDNISSNVSSLPSPSLSEYTISSGTSLLNSCDVSEDFCRLRGDSSSCNSQIDEYHSAMLDTLSSSDHNTHKNPCGALTCKEVSEGMFEQLSSSQHRAPSKFNTQSDSCTHGEDGSDGDKNHENDDARRYVPLESSFQNVIAHASLKAVLSVEDMEDEEEATKF